MKIEENAENQMSPELQTSERDELLSRKKGNDKRYGDVPFAIAM